MGETVMIRVELMEIDKFLHYWPMIEKQLDFVPHMWALWWTKDSIREGVVEERFQCWGVGDDDVVTAVIFTRVSTYPANTIFQAFLAFGDGLIEAIDEIEAVFERYCAIRGVTVAEISGRPGWGPVLRKKGFGQTGTTMSKKLDIARLQ
jgi:hypothetical protein